MVNKFLEMVKSFFAPLMWKSPQTNKHVDDEVDKPLVEKPAFEGLVEVTFNTRLCIHVTEPYRFQMDNDRGAMSSGRVYQATTVFIAKEIDAKTLMAAKDFLARVKELVACTSLKAACDTAFSMYMTDTFLSVKTGESLECFSLAGISLTTITHAIRVRDAFGSDESLTTEKGLVVLQDLIDTWSSHLSKARSEVSKAEGQSNA